MSLILNKREQDAIIAVLHHEHASDTIKAIELLKAFEEIFKDRAKFVVIGQLKSSAQFPGGIPTDSVDAIKVSLGWYSTEGEANKAADSLWSGASQGTGDEFRRWVLPMFHGTPAEFHKEQKRKYAELETKRREKRSEQIQADIARMKQRNQEIADRTPEEWARLGY